MKKIQLWSVDQTEGRLSATPVHSVDNTETEQHLEDLLVASPDLLVENLTLIGRQVPTDGGPLDLLGIDGDGRLVVFELKRGTLTRDAVAQVLDYASDLAALDDTRFADLVEQHSGRHGIDRIEDFADWYRQEHPGQSQLPLERPRAVLVGLGALRSVRGKEWTQAEPLDRHLPDRRGEVDEVVDRRALILESGWLDRERLRW